MATCVEEGERGKGINTMANRQAGSFRYRKIGTYQRLPTPTETRKYKTTNQTRTYLQQIKNLEDNLGQ
jgi:hypothetical protein